MRFLISSTGSVTAAKTMLPNFLFSVSGVLNSPFATFFSCSRTLLTAKSNGTWAADVYFRKKMKGTCRKHTSISAFLRQKCYRTGNSFSNEACTDQKWANFLHYSSTSAIMCIIGILSFCIDSYLGLFTKVSIRIQQKN